jgi:hypothetical protein
MIKLYLMKLNQATQAILLQQHQQTDQVYLVMQTVMVIVQ